MQVKSDQIQYIYINFVHIDKHLCITLNTLYNWKKTSFGIHFVEISLILFFLWLNSFTIMSMAPDHFVEEHHPKKEKNDVELIKSSAIWAIIA